MDEIWADLPRNLILWLVLFVISIGYDQIIRWMEKKGYDEGLTAFQVAVGTAYTLLVAVIAVGWAVALFILACFFASGLPMIAGAVWRYVKKRQRLQSLQKIVRSNGQQT